METLLSKALLIACACELECFLSLSHLADVQVLAVGVPHERLQEVVGLVVVPKAHVPWPSDLGLLQRYASQRQVRGLEKNN